MPARNFTFILYSIIIVVLNANTSIAAEKAKPRHLVEVVTAESLESNTVNNWHGSLNYSQLVNIYNQEKGRIDSFPYKEGDYVKKNASLVKLDDRLLIAEKQRLLAQILQAKTDRNRINTLVKKQALSVGELDQANTQLAILEADKNLLDIRLSYFNIKAPFSGIVTQRLVNKGDAVSAQQHLLTLSNNRSLVAKVQVSETALSSLNKGTVTTIIVPSSGQKFEGKISRIYPTLHPTTRQATIEITFDKHPENLFSGQSVLAEIKGATKNRILIPLAALKRDGEGEYVYLLKDDKKAHRQTVISSVYISGRVEIVSGVQVNDQVITRGFLGLQNGKDVKISGQKDPTEKKKEAISIPIVKKGPKPGNSFSDKVSNTWGKAMDKVKAIIN